MRKQMTKNLNNIITNVVANEMIETKVFLLKKEAVK